MSVMNSMIKTLPKLYRRKTKCPARGLNDIVQTVFEQKSSGVGGQVKSFTQEQPV